MRIRFVLFLAVLAGLLSFGAPAHASTFDAVATHYNDAGGEGFAGPMATASYTWGLRPADLKRVYNIPSATGSPTVAVTIAYDNPNIESDLGVYRAQFGLPPCTTANGCFKKVNQYGGPTMPQADVGWGQELALDVEMVSAACPNCKILVVAANSPNFSDLLPAVTYAQANANYISNSWGTDEFPEVGQAESYFNKPGKIFTFSTGDNGFGVAYPASSRHVIAVGGTSLHLDQAGNRTSETAWSGAGSGCSAYITKPAWQTDTGCPRRSLADISAVADPQTGVAVYSSYGSVGGNWMVYGGTSASAPIVAGIYAASADKIASPLRDITFGSNGTCLISYLCLARVGYDGPTGRGVPNGPAMALTNRAPVVSNKTKSCTLNTCTFTVTAYDPEARPLSYAWTGNVSATKTAVITFAATGAKKMTAGVKDGVNTTYTSIAVNCAYQYVNGWKIVCA